MTRAEISRKFDEIVAFAEVGDYLDIPVKRYSSGMQMRPGLAVAAHLEPEMLLVDEALAVGDAAFQQRCLGKMGDVRRSGRTIVFVSHDLGAVQSLCDRALLLREGSVAAEGPASAVVDAYLAGLAASGESGRGYAVNAAALGEAQIDGFRITGLELDNPAFPEAGPRTGDPLVIRIAYESARTFWASTFVVGVADQLGSRAFLISTMPASGYRIEALHPRGVMELRIGSLPLVPGRYELDVGFGPERVEWTVRYERVASFDVQFADLYSSGFIPSRSRGLVYVQHEWNHHASELTAGNGRG
jgi:lipopolysaccharide transport system ATP-binding protein